VPLLSPEQTSDRLPTQDAAAVLPTQDAALEKVSTAPGPSPELRQQLEAMGSDIAVVRHIVERLAAVEEQVAVNIAMLQKSVQKASLLPHSPPVPAPSRKHAPNNVAAHSPSAPVPAAPARTPWALLQLGKWR
jgi:hypothetical protein